MSDIDSTFNALSDKTRRAILERLLQGDTKLSEIAEPFDMSQTAVSKHVRILSDAGLIEVEKRGRTRFCRLKASPLKDANEWLQNYQQFWTHQFDNLAGFLIEEENDK